MGPNKGGNPKGEIQKAIDSVFGNFEQFKEKFNAAGAGQFGSGWVWLTLSPQKRLEIVATPNQDTPISMGHQVVLGNDVWEHAYYLTYENRRPEYLKAWWNVVDWDAVEARFLKQRG
jgi:Fe-Mn family superoxide dismutase